MIKAFDPVATPIESRCSDHFDKQCIRFTLVTTKLITPTLAIWQSGKFSLRGPTERADCRDLCFVWDDTETLQELIDQLKAHIEEGLVLIARW